MKIISDLIQNNNKTFNAVTLDYPTGAFDQIFSFDDFSHLLRTARFVENDIWLYRSGNQIKEFDLQISRSNKSNPWINPKRFSNQKLYQHFLTEKTGFKINSIYDFSEKLNSFRKDLAKTLISSVSVNCYYSPAESEKLLAAHRDNYNILILQIHGKKKFYFGEITDEKVQADKKSLVLSAGQALYLPANLSHYAEPAEGSDSLHLTIGIHDLMFSEYIEFLMKRNQSWKMLVEKKFPLNSSGNLATDEMAELILQASTCMREQLGDAEFLNDFLKVNLDVSSEI